MVECTICFQTINNNNIVKTDCEHEFHSSCFLTNIVCNGFNCPSCRKKLISLKHPYNENEDVVHQKYVNLNKGTLPSLNYMMNKLERIYSKREILKKLIIIHNKYWFEEETNVDQDFSDIFMTLTSHFESFGKERGEIELMMMEDINCIGYKTTELVNDFETIINTRIY